MKKIPFFISHKLAQLNKLTKRLKKLIESQKFALLSKYQQRKRILKIHRLFNSLNQYLPFNLKHKLVASALVLSLMGAGNLQAQEFKPAVRNGLGFGPIRPFASMITPAWNEVDLVDIDSDGDIDVIVKEDYNSHDYHFVPSSYNMPTGVQGATYFADLDGDGDVDMFIANGTNNLLYYQNIGTTSPVFTSSPISNPFSFPNNLGAIEFVDIDNDGDLDLFGYIRFQGQKYYENIGSATSSNFIERTNLFGLTGASQFADIDNDGDLDAFGHFSFQENIGTASAPQFDTIKTYPFGLTPPGHSCLGSCAIGDVDDDGDVDLLFAEYYGNFEYYENVAFANNIQPSMPAIAGDTIIHGRYIFKNISGFNPGTNERQLMNYSVSYTSTNPGLVQYITLGTGCPLVGSFCYCPDFIGPGEFLFFNLQTNLNQCGSIDVTITIDDNARTNNTFSRTFNVLVIGCTVPVEFVDFTAQADEKDIILNWQTAQELNNSGFEIQRSLDGENFEKIAWKEGNGNSQDLIDYEFIDQNVLANQTYFYRLKQIDFNGEFEYSGIVSAKVSGAAFDLVAYPNPAQNTIQIQFSQDLFQPVDLSIFSLDGKLLLNEQIQENNFNFDVSSLSAGIYLIKAKNNNQIVTKRLVIQK